MRKAGTVSGSGSCETIDRRSGFRWNNRQETFSQRAVNLIALVTSTAAICNSGVYRFYSITAAYTGGGPWRRRYFIPTKEIEPTRQIFSEKHFPFASGLAIDSFDYAGQAAALFRYARHLAAKFHFPSPFFPLLTKETRRNAETSQFSPYRACIYIHMKMQHRSLSREKKKERSSPSVKSFPIPPSAALAESVRTGVAMLSRKGEGREKKENRRANCRCGEVARSAS